MNAIIVDELTPGMVLAEDIFDRNGRFLIGKGISLTEKHLRVLKIWGITEARVESVSEENAHAAAAAMLAPEMVQKAERMMMNRFCRMDMEHEAVRELFRICTLRAARRMAEKDGRAEEENEDISLKMNLKVYNFWKQVTTVASPFELLGKDLKLPALPNIFFQISDAINDPRSSARDIADIIKNDTSLTAKLLKIANSPIYGLSATVDSIPRAVTIIGTKEIGIIALGITIMRCFKGIPDCIIDMKAFWKHSLACGIAARTIAGFKRVANVERAFTAGLLHDIGRLLLYKYLPDEANSALLQARTGSKHLYETEQEVFGVQHAVIGGMLLREWRLPVSIENTVKYHHNPMDAAAPLEPSIVSVADLMANAMGIGSSGELLLLPLDPEVWKCLDVSKGIFSAVMKQIDRQIDETSRVFLSDD